MKGILKFNLDDHDDDMALKRCHKSLATAMVLWEFLNNSRGDIEEKGGDEKTLDMVYEHFTDLLEKNCIIIDELIE